jgi:hypothetical protein
MIWIFFKLALCSGFKTMCNQKLFAMKKTIIKSLAFLMSGLMLTIAHAQSGADGASQSPTGRDEPKTECKTVWVIVWMPGMIGFSTPVPIPTKVCKTT